MWAFGVVVIFYELFQESLQMSLAHNDHVVQKLPAQGFNEALDIRTLPWASVGNTYFLDAATFEKRRNSFAIYPVIVSMQVARMFIPRCGVA